MKIKLLLHNIYWYSLNKIDRLTILLDFLKLKAIKKLKISTKNRVRLAGYIITYPDIQQLTQLYKEIFVKKNYYCNLKKDPVIFDAGANIGLSTLFFKKIYPNSRIVAFEPNPEAYNFLINNLNINNIQNVVVHNIALGNKDGEIEFYLSSNMATADIGASTIKEHVEYFHKNKGKMKIIKVPCKKLSDFIQGKIDLLKLDIEGSESIVISELDKRIKNIANIIMEYHYNFTHQNNPLSSIISIMEKNNYLFKIIGGREARKLNEEITYIIRSLNTN